MTTRLSTAPVPPAPLAGALRLSGDDLKQVDALILSRLKGELPLIQQVGQHIIASGGKRLRPFTTLLSARLCGYEGSRHIGLAAAVELIHTATLLHDDVVDESRLRRGLATANEVFGNKTSVLVGDFLFTQSFQLMVADGSLHTLKILSEAAATIASGELKQLLTEGELETSEASYLDVIYCKTAAMFAAAAELGAVVADTPEAETPLREFGTALGMAFQLVDDVLDYQAEQQALGKTVGDDFREGKITLPVLIAYQRGDENARQFWQRCLAEENAQTEADLSTAIALMQACGALQAASDKAKEYCTKARHALATFDDSAEKTALVELIDFCESRTY